MQSFDLSRLRRGLKPFRLHWFARLRSTNDHAAVLRRRGELLAPAVVLTGRQTAGRGRGQNIWWSGPGCLTVTFALPIDQQIAPHQLPLIAGLAVRNAAAELVGGLGGDDRILLKWPNDLLYQEKKLGGLLCERVLKADLVGIGLNLNADVRSAPPAARGGMTTLAAIAGRPIDPTDALLCIAARLRETMLRGANRPFAALLEEYDSHHALVGRRVSVLDGPDAQVVSGRCKGLDSVGRLLLTDGRKIHRIISGQVILRP